MTQHQLHSETDDGRTFHKCVAPCAIREARCKAIAGAPSIHTDRTELPEPMNSGFSLAAAVATNMKILFVVARRDSSLEIGRKRFEIVQVVPPSAEGLRLDQGT